MPNAKQIAPFGSWKSPITPALIAESTVRFQEVLLDGDRTYVIELRPWEKGRSVLVELERKAGSDATPAGTDVLPATVSVRTRVHEYGGGEALIADGVVYFVNDEDQRVYRAVPGGAPVPLTPSAPDHALRYADFTLDRVRKRLLAVREDHAVGAEPENTLVAIDIEPAGEPRPARVLVRGADFYSSPRLSPDGGRLAWLSWNHPNMPWDGTTLWTTCIGADGELAVHDRVAGGERESIIQPTWSPTGELHFVSDRSGYWNLYRQPKSGASPAPLCPRAAEFGAPPWGFGMATYAFAADGRIICAFTEQGSWRIAALDPRTGELRPYDLPYTAISTSCGVRVHAGRAVFVACSPTEPDCVVELDLERGKTQVLRGSAATRIDPGYVSIPEAIEFPTAAGQTAHAFYYPPANRDFEPPPGTRPPLLVLCHGGPTSAVWNSLDWKLQFWTSRGFAVANVNYGGSSGYGRAYRERLEGQWGVVDVDDCGAAAQALVARGAADPAQLAIAGGSSGGYTVLCALAFRDVFRAGASHYGVSDLETLAWDTHKFESRYLDRLVGPYPAARELYIERSPVHHADRIRRPVIFFQGLEDPIVPPNQAERMVAALKERGVPTAYLAFPGEQHGFRRAESITRTLDAELAFYGRVFGFTPADPIAPFPIENAALLAAPPAAAAATPPRR